MRVVRHSAVKEDAGEKGDGSDGSEGAFAGAHGHLEEDSRRDKTPTGGHCAPARREADGTG